uniref:Uncharacterized protein n=1 Tax=Amphimedon queenslandica TaxID=400682 RepID=A0A1X7USZ4_AMPQE
MADDGEAHETDARPNDTAVEDENDDLFYDSVDWCKVATQKENKIKELKGDKRLWGKGVGQYYRENVTLHTGPPTLPPVWGL